VQFIFGDHTLDTERCELLHLGAAIAVQPQVFDLSVYLLQNCQRVVSKDDLIALVWQGQTVSDSTLASRINAGRIAIGDSGRDQKLIRTIPRKGFRFVGRVTGQLHDIQPADAPPTESQPRPALPLPDRPAIAVLPFNNMSGDREQEYFSDGISADIITALSKLRWFFVIARNSSFIYKGKAVHLKQIAEELGVRYVVEAARGRTATSCALRHSSTTRRQEATSGRTAMTEISPTFLRFRTRSPTPSSPPSSQGSMSRKISAPGANRRIAWMRGIW
jgi:DNA-binding winged helix-turn-helix (wHTH) protein